jgi:hypothetical protein
MTRKSCSCDGGTHAPWCPRFIDDVDPKAKIPLDTNETTAIDNAIVDTIRRGAEKFGVEKVRDALLSIILANEEHIRQNFSPDHAALKVRDRREMAFCISSNFRSKRS